ncbi:MAG TPA: hypothetical protein IAA06_13105 [Candidatus Blautia faecavium]|uniref:Uncharacterized protein n=1 Tax=Candidatus Blautia faecavium TaxID=2838487 RepID=A0A9D2LV83_9FIRM|nr:hypothetical protein [Candidatus Blautia faecavium]
MKVIMKVMDFLGLTQENPQNALKEFRDICIGSIGVLGFFFGIAVLASLF